ncbi:MAG: FeoB-associated Cys-rich membrane protein [Anaerovoracaceae bacterium]
MLNWISNNIGTIVIGAVVAAALAAAILRMIKNKKEGKSSCGCGSSCTGCAMSGSCRKKSRSH